MTLQLDNPAVLFIIFIAFSVWSFISWAVGGGENKSIGRVAILPIFFSAVAAIICLIKLIVDAL